MENQNSAQLGCTHCACNNPMWNILEEELFHPEKILKTAEGLTHQIHAEALSLVISGGTIRPLTDGKMDNVEAIGIHHGKVIATGSKAAVEAEMQKKGIAFEFKQLQDAEVLLPGFIDPHVHIVPTALLMGWMDLGRFDNQKLKPEYNEQTIGVIINKERTGPNREKYDKGNWLLGKGADPALMPFVHDPKAANGIGLTTFTCDSLDEIVKDVPLMMLSASMHTAYVNTKAMQLTYDHTPEIHNKMTFEEYKASNHGQLQEGVGMEPALKTIPLSQLSEMVIGCFSHLKTFFEEANKRGHTFLYDAGMNDAFKSLLKIYLHFYPNNIRIGAAKMCSSQADADKLKQYEPVTEYSDVYYGNAKIISDGSNQGLTGYQSEHYCCLPDSKGKFNFTADGDPEPVEVPAPYKELLNTVAIKKGWPLMTHANGDQAINFTIQVYDELIKTQTGTPVRHRIEHASLLSDQNIKDIKRLEILPSFLIGHVGYWGYAFRDAIFGEKAEILDRCKSALDAGIKISLHTDCEVTQLGPLRMMEQSITRIMEAAPGNPEENVLNAAECISPEQALRTVTTDAAYHCYAEKWVGSLAVGHFSDFVILQQDPLHLESNYMQMRDIKVLETWKGGVMVYQLPVPEQVSLVND
ncbi:amidohydrolase [Pedobacter sp. KBW06]|uniref:amidohydrolase n=1 Tax=Pedobacter sp. KBW06 TaxID=2153359 RepID=UPI000F58FBF6|nr:amidohydrolase family protein [Pedobacter sp. KBW06]RQO66425.1 amidohydrolase [Pedobacter sp. KBW06]